MGRMRVRAEAGLRVARASDHEILAAAMPHLDTRKGEDTDWVITDNTGRILHFPARLRERIGANIRPGDNLLEQQHIVKDPWKSETFAKLIMAGEKFHRTDFEHSTWSQEVRGDLEGIPLLRKSKTVLGVRIPPKRIGALIVSRDLTERDLEDARLRDHAHSLKQHDVALGLAKRVLVRLDRSPHEDPLLRKHLDGLVAAGRLTTRQRASLDKALQESSASPLVHPKVSQVLGRFNLDADELETLGKAIENAHPLTSKALRATLEALPKLAQAVTATVEELAARTEYKPGPVNLGDILRHTLSIASGELPVGTVVDVDIPENGALKTHMLPAHAWNIASNLVTNAREKLNEQSESNRRLAVSARASPDAIHFFVTNSGDIPESIRDQVFRQRGITSKSGTGRARGRGLAHIHEMVTRNGGTIEFETGNGETTFHVSLPRVTEPPKS
ncbi:hypothetical protein AUJ14_02250 [Candidatus Micrarchaeota archaeon CG1_02_55_22]|nr:MAG: hypothetical protein AUJ14_02250 [Candidatus Micrarchaeota archaeon CG1_02_55_22]